MNRTGDKRPYDIRQRVFEYSLEAIRLFKDLQAKRDAAASVIARQFLRSATSIGANLEEAQSAESRADFIHKCGLAQKEARESLYWLKLIQTASLESKEKVESIVKETDELIAIITTIIVKAKKRLNYEG